MCVSTGGLVHGAGCAACVFWPKLASTSQLTAASPEIIDSRPKLRAKYRSIPKRTLVSLQLAKLYFRFAAMNAGKSTSLLQVAHNYEERGQSVDLYNAQVDDRYGVGNVTSRLGVTREAATFTADTDFAAIYAAKPAPSCILIDEAQFLRITGHTAPSSCAHLFHARNLLRPAQRLPRAALPRLQGAANAGR